MTDINATALTVCKFLRRTLPLEFNVVSECEGIIVRSQDQICGSYKVVEIWLDLSLRWHWRSLYLEDDLSGAGTIFDCQIAVENILKIAADAK